MDQATPAVKASIRPNVANMIKTKGGSFHKDDFIGTTLAGLSVAQVIVIAISLGIESSKYSHLNPGQQRMTLGNTLRKMTNIAAVPPDAEGKPDQKIVDKNEAAYAVRDKIEDAAVAMKEANEAAAKEKAEAKAAAAAEKAAAKAKAKAPAAVESEGGEV